MIGFHTKGLSTDEARKDGSVFGLVRRLSKRRPAGRQAGHQGRLTGIYAEGIELNGGSQVAAGGFTTTFGLLGGATCLYFMLPFWSRLFAGSSGWPKYILLLFTVLAASSIFLIGIYFEMFTPSEQPIYFDRKRRKVYYVQRGARRRFFLFGPSTIEERVVDWDLVDAEHHTKARASTASVGRDHYLVLLMRTSASDPTIAGHYVIGPVDFPGALWEYIRRYMEKDEPPLQSDEAPPYKGQGFDMIEALKQRRRDYWKDWKEFPWTQLWQHLALPLFAVFFVVNRCVVWTAQKVNWPQEVKDALGSPITEEELKADPTHRLRPAGEAATAA